MGIDRAIIILLIRVFSWRVKEIHMHMRIYSGLLRRFRTESFDNRYK